MTTQQVAGWGAAPRTFVTDPLARGGVTVRHIRAEPRRITWPLHVYGDTHQEFVGRYRSLMRAFMLTAQMGRPGVLRVSRPDGTAREIEAFCEDGWSGAGGENWVYANPVLTLMCPDGFWRDTEPRAVRREYQSGGSPFLSPYLTVSPGQVLGATEVVNPGDVDGWPIWTITGPSTLITAANHTTGQQFGLSYNLPAGEAIVVDTSTHRPTVRGPAGQNLVGALNWPGADLWSFTAGVNSVEFTVDGSGAGTSLEVLFFPRYEAA
ncbi:hypothetical protein ABT336_13290 [Micromonospora sp. NPDC000207]|uniref:hypothetical protein n=1 Tax=Micromonospora sp. NPDC000207 TaxID=3154246 RepID=UPI00331A9352